MSATSSAFTFALGLPDDRIVNTAIDAAGNPSMVFPNQLKFPPQTAALLQSTDQMVWFPIKPETGTAPVTAVINMCTEVHSYKQALASMRAWCPAGVPVFNDPNAVIHTQSNAFKAGLAKIAGLDVPQNTVFQPQTPADFEAAFAAAGLDYPVRLQRTTDRNNTAVLLITSPDDWVQAHALDWVGGWYTLSQLHSDDLTQHARMRVCFVGQGAQTAGFPFAYQPIAIDRTLRPERMIGGDVLQRICSDLLRLVMLDFWTAEFSVRAEDRLQLEYIWVGLPTADNAPDPSAPLWSKIAKQLHTHVSSPRSWRAADLQPRTRLQ